MAEENYRRYEALVKTGETTQKTFIVVKMDLEAAKKEMEGMLAEGSELVEFKEVALNS